MGWDAYESIALVVFTLSILRLWNSHASPLVSFEPVFFIILIVKRGEIEWYDVLSASFGGNGVVSGIAALTWSSGAEGLPCSFGADVACCCGCGRRCDSAGEEAEKGECGV